MKLKPTEILDNVYQNLKIDIGRHLYAVLGTYDSLKDFTTHALSQARLSDGSPFPAPISVNRVLLDRFDEDSLSAVILKESKRPKATQAALDQAFEGFLREKFSETNFLILQHLELMFAYSIDLSKLRRWAANQNHILVLLPGEVRNQQIYLFTNPATGESLKFDNQLFAENNIWEITHD